MKLGLVVQVIVLIELVELGILIGYVCFIVMVGEEYGILGVNCLEEVGVVKDLNVLVVGEFISGNVIYVYLGSYNYWIVLIGWVVYFLELECG